VGKQGFLVGWEKKKRANITPFGSLDKRRGKKISYRKGMTGWCLPPIKIRKFGERKKGMSLVP